MWTRKQLKDKGKTSFKGNYWKSVLVALVLMGALFGSYTWNSNASSMSASSSTQAGQMQMTDSYVESDGDTLVLRDGGDEVVIDKDHGITVRSDEGGAEVTLPDPDSDNLVTIDANAEPELSALTPVMLAGLFVAILIALVLGVVLYAFVYNPLQAGCRGFFTANLNRPAQVRDVAAPFDHGYLNCVKAMILRDIFTFLWTLLLIIPGIIKSYEYRMIPYLAVDNPEMTYKELFAESKRLMHGNKWKAFVLDLSFIGWWFLSVLTLGLLGVFYVGPYYAATSAALYEELQYGNAVPQFANEPIPAIPIPAAPVAEPNPQGAHAIQR